MKGYVYLDLDNNLVYKLASYIDNEDPGFFGRNGHLIIKRWVFNTEDHRRMLDMFKEFMDRKIPVDNVNNFIKSIRYDMNNLKNANQV